MILDRLLNALGLSWLTLDAAAGPEFSVNSVEQLPSDVDVSVFGFTTSSDDDSAQLAPAPKVSRAQAIQVPAVKRGRDLVAGTIGQLPFRMLDTTNVVQLSSLLEQPEANLARSVTMTRLVEDLLFESVGWWRVVERDFRDYPRRVVRLEPTSVRLFPDGRWYVGANGVQGMSWTYTEERDLIRFDSPNDGILTSGARAIRTYLRLSSAADNYAKDPMPQGYFHPAVPYELEQEEVDAALERWATARRSKATGYVPQNLAYERIQWSPEQLQMGEARQHAVLELARIIGVDPEELGVSTTSRTYANMQDRRLARIQDTLGPYVEAIAERLSMPDITPRGYRVRADYSGFLRADDASRFAAYEVALRLGITDVPQILEREELPEPTVTAAPAPERTPDPEPVEASMSRPALTFDAAPALFGFDTDEQRRCFEADTAKREIYGLAVPYGVAASKAGQRWQFSKGTLTWTDPSRVKLLMEHDRGQAIGKAIELTEDDTGLWARFKVARGAEGDRALALAEDGVWDGLSIAVGVGGRFTKRAGVQHAVSVPLEHIALTPVPAFSDARVNTVAASADDPTKEGTAMPCSNCGQNHAPGTPCATPAEASTTTTTTTDTAPAFDADAFMAQIAQTYGLTPAASGGPTPVSPHHGRAEVNEAPAYVVDRSGSIRRGTHDFSTDLFAALRDGDRAANDRVLAFMGDRFETVEARRLAFDVDSGDVNEATIDQTWFRPDLYVDQRAYKYPVWDAFRKETISDVTPLVIPKYNSSATLVSAHTEGTEPTAGSFTLTSQTITPTAHSGKVEITREVWDMGGSPQVSNLIWAKMESAFYEALEAKAIATLTAAVGSITDIALTTAAADDALSSELAAAIAALQFVRGGFTFDQFAAQIDLYKALVDAVGADDRPLFPILGPTNTNGQAAPAFGEMNVHGVRAYPSWAAGATSTSSSNSWLFDKGSVYGAASAPKRLTFEYRVAYIDLAIWGYSAFGVIDTAGVRQVTYDPAA